MPINRCHFIDLFQRLPASSGEIHLESVELQVQTHELEDVRIVVDNEDGLIHLVLRPWK